VLLAVGVSNARYSLILLVEANEARLADMLKTLRSEGYQTTGAATFEEARRQIALDPPRFLIAGARLGPYNGMHLAFLARRHRAECDAIIIGSGEGSLERESVQEGFAYLPGPLPAHVLPTLVTALGAERPLPAATKFWIDPKFDRRLGERRRHETPGFTPERRQADRRRP
jgi:DNA-binding NtrC family response regulator